MLRVFINFLQQSQTDNSMGVVFFFSNFLKIVKKKLLSFGLKKVLLNCLGHLDLDVKCPKASRVDLVLGKLGLSGSQLQLQKGSGSKPQTYLLLIRPNLYL